MVFHCRCFSFSLEENEEIEYETITQTNSSKTETFHTACSDLSLSASNFHSKTTEFPNLVEKPSKLRVFTVAELKAATKNFCGDYKLGEGGFGSVYKGVIKSLEYPFHEVQVAVKYAEGVFQANGPAHDLGYVQHGHKEWVTEISILGVVKHPNLVKLIGHCIDYNKRGIQLLLVYEYMHNRSVRDYLSSQSKTPLSWNRRLKVAQDAALGLTYLHEDMDFQISNLPTLLDDEWNAKLSDFGLARLGPREGLTHITTMFAGTMTYAAPEYIETGHLSTKCDVWSYGVFLFELITGRPPLDKNRPRNEKKLLEWVKPYLDVKRLRLIIDSRLEGNYSIKSARKLSYTASRCLSKDPKLRPNMSEVLEMVNQLISVPS